MANKMINAAKLFHYPNKYYHENCGSEVHWHHRRIDRSTPKARLRCFLGKHEASIKDVSTIRPTTYHCKYCYGPMPEPEEPL